MSEELYWVGGQLLGLVVIAALVNQVAPIHRARIRRAIILFALYILFLSSATLLADWSPGWADRVQLGADLFRAISLVNLTCMLVFLVVLPAVRLKVPTIIGDLIAGVAYVVAIVAVLTEHEVDASKVFASAAVVSAVLVISLQNTLGNILGGVALQLDGSVHDGDFIQLENGRRGRVRAIRWRHTLVETSDYTTIVVPNQLLLTNNITILGWMEGRREPHREWVHFNVDFRFAPAHVIRVVDEAIGASPIMNVAPSPKPNTVCTDIASTGNGGFASYAVRYWLERPLSRTSTSSRVRARIFAALKRAEIPLAVPATANLVEVHDQARKDRRMERETSAHLAALRTVQLFAALTEDELRTLAEGMAHVAFTAGETIMRQGEVSQALFVMTAGTVEVRTTVDPDGAGPAPAHVGVVATLTAPDFFGEMGVMTGEPRRADVVAATDVECFRLPKAPFEEILTARPEIANEVSERLAQRQVALAAVREGLDEKARAQRQARERERIRDNIKQFFGL